MEGDSQISQSQMQGRANHNDHANGNGNGMRKVEATTTLNSLQIQTTNEANRFSFLAIVGMAYAILNSWVAMSASLSVVLPSGGPVAMIWGLVISFVGVLCIAASLAEICAVLPTSGGPYHWSYVFAPPGWERVISYSNGWINTAGWVCLTATTSSLGASFVTGIIALLHSNYEVQSWHTFLVYIGFAILGWLVNVFLVKILDPVNRAALIWSLAGACLICITCLACASPDYQSGKLVFGTFINSTGWPNGVAFILGLLQSTFGLVGIDGCTHMAEEVPDPHKSLPRAMILAPIIGALSSWIVLVIFLFVLGDIDTVTDSSAGALLEIIFEAIGNRGGSVALLMFPVGSMAFAAIAILCSSSRQVQAFARDQGLPFSRFFAKQNEKLRVPVPAITFTSVWVIIFGCVYLGSTSALNAILSSSVVLLQISYCVPVILLIVRGRHLLDTAAGPVLSQQPRTINLGRFGLPINLFGVLFAIFTSVFFCFPPELPVSGPNMNYVSVVIAIVFIISGLTYWIQGKKYTGPKNIEYLLERAQAARTDELGALGMASKGERGSGGSDATLEKPA